MNTTESPKTLTDLIPLIDELVDIAHRSSRLGLVILEKYRDQQDNFWLKKGLSLILRGTESDNISRIFTNYLRAGKFSGVEEAQVRIVLEAMICISRRDPLEDMEDVLFSVIGDQGREIHHKKKLNQRQKKISDFLSNTALQEQEGSDAGEKLLNFSDRQLVMLMEQVSFELLGPFLAGEKHSLQCRFLQLLDEKSQSELIDQLEMGFLDISIEKSRKLVSYRVRRIAGEFKDEEILSQKEVDALLRSNG